MEESQEGYEWFRTNTAVIFVFSSRVLGGLSIFCFYLFSRPVQPIRGSFFLFFFFFCFTLTPEAEKPQVFVRMVFVCHTGGFMSLK